jgi:hypothetical protein
MKKVFVAALLTLPFLAVPARAHWCPHLFPFCIEVGGNSCLRVYGGPCQSHGCQLGPWYQYFPYEAHFQSAAPISFPYWPSPQTLPPESAGAGYQYPQYSAAAPPQAYPLQPTNYQPPLFQPVGYYPAPSYWYGR